MSVVLGAKRMEFIESMILPNLPLDWKERVYIEPFGGSFAVGFYLKKVKSKLTTIYNDIVKYDIEISDRHNTSFNTDYRKILDSFNFPDCLFYLDPPYYGKEDWYGMTKNDRDFHIELFEKVKDLKCPFLISYEDCEFIRSLYKRFMIVKYQGENKTYRNEILIKNY